MRRRYAAPALALALLTARELHAECKGRPTDPSGYEGYGYGDVPVKSYATAKVRVHWAESGPHAAALASTRPDGVPDTVAYAGDMAELALTKYAEMGYRPVPSDAACPSNGGDEKLDIYLVKFTAADGLTVAECDGTSCPSFALVDSRYESGGYANPQEGFRTVITHELFHAVQNQYKQGDEGFWAEGTAQWAMKTVHPELQDFERQLAAFFEDPGRSLDAPPTGVAAGYLYGSAVWPLFLATNHGPETIRAIFEAEAAGAKAIAATDAVLQTKGSSLAEAYPMFAAWNVATGTLAGTGGYPDAAKYPGVKTAKLEDGVNAITSGLDYFAYRGTLDAPHQITLDTDATRNGGVVVPLEDGKARVDRAQKLPANAEGEVIVVVAGTTTKKTDAPFTIHFGDPVAAPASSSSSSGAPAPASDGGGCSTTPARRTSSPVLLVALGALGLALVRRRR